MPSISYTPHLMELLRSQTQHNAFPSNIVDGMLSPTGASIQSITEIDDFIVRLFIFDMPKNFFIQLAVAGSWICILLIIGSICVFHRIFKKAFWLFKLQKRIEGTYVVPNALNSFLFFQGFFAIIWLTLMIINYEAFWLKNKSMQYHIGALGLIVWWPLYLGAFMAGWGSFYTAPGALEKGPISSSKVGKLASRPLVINICCLGTPFVLIGSLLAPTILTQQHYNSAFNAYQNFHAHLMDAISSSPDQILPPSVAMEYLDAASQVWQMQTVSIWYASIGYAIWSIWAGILLLFYIPAGGYLCFLLWKQLQTQKVAFIALKMQRRELDQIDRENQKPASLFFQPLQNTDKQDETTKSQLRFATLKAIPTSDVKGNNESFEILDEEKEDVEADFFFPPLAPAIKNKTMPKPSTPQSRYKYLRRCFINLFILYIRIVLGASLYLGVAASLARLYYKSYLTNPQDCMHITYNCIIITAWGAVIFGTLTIFAIFARFADPANESYNDQEKNSRQLPLLPKFLQRSTSDKTLVDSTIQRQDKLSTIDQQQQSNNSNFLESKETLGKGIRFKLRKRSGNIIMHPADASLDALDDNCTTSIDLTEYIQSDHMSRRVPSFVPEDMTQGSVFEEDEMHSRNFSS